MGRGHHGRRNLSDGERGGSDWISVGRGNDWKKMERGNNWKRERGNDWKKMERGNGGRRGNFAGEEGTGEPALHLFQSLQRKG
jgi:hypothetical protein